MLAHFLQAPRAFSENEQARAQEMQRAQVMQEEEQARGSAWKWDKELKCIWLYLF